MSRKLDKINEALGECSRSLGECGRSLGNLCSALVDFFRAFLEFTLAVLPPETIEAAIKDQRITAAIAGASPRVRHLALHGKKHRTRKKNRNRALREYLRKEAQP